MKIISLTCPACGGQLKSGTKTCGFCGVVVEIVDERTARLVHEDAAEYCPICGCANRKVDTFRCTRCGRQALCRKHAEEEGVCSDCIAAERAAENARQEAVSKAAQAASSKAPLWLGVGVAILLGFGGILWLDSRAKEKEEAQRVAQDQAGAAERELAARRAAERQRDVVTAPTPSEATPAGPPDLEQALMAASHRIARGDEWFTLTSARHHSGPTAFVRGVASSRAVVDALVEDLGRSSVADRVALAETADDGARGYRFSLSVSMRGWTSSTPEQTLTVPSLPRPPIPWRALLPEEQDQLWADTKDKVAALLPPLVLVTDQRREGDRHAAILVLPGDPAALPSALLRVQKAITGGGFRVLRLEPQARVSDNWRKVDLEVALESR